MLTSRVSKYLVGKDSAEHKSTASATMSGPTGPVPVQNYQIRKSYTPKLVAWISTFQLLVVRHKLSLTEDLRMFPVPFLVVC